MYASLVPVSPDQTIDGKYRVGRRIGEGGMGTVYEGENIRIGRRVAIKVLHAHVAERPEFASRFEREARVAAKIGSPHICDVLDLGDLPDGERFIVMEYLEGVSLEDRLAKGKMSPDTLAPIAFELLDGLATMHGAGVIHRDLKPANIFLAKSTKGRGEVVKILDFGVSKFLPEPGETSDMTQTGTLMGTPLYMSPEQARGIRNIDGRSDLYSASVIFYRALSGELPFTADTFNQLMFRIALEEPRSVREHAPEVDAEIASIIHRGLAREVEARFRSAREYQDAVVSWAKTHGRTSFSAMQLHESAPVQPAPSKEAPSREGTPIAWSEDGPELTPPPAPNADLPPTVNNSQPRGTPVPAPAPPTPAAQSASGRPNSTLAIISGTTQTSPMAPPLTSQSGAKHGIAASAPPSTSGARWLVPTIGMTTALLALAVYAGIHHFGRDTSGGVAATPSASSTPASSMAPPSASDTPAVVESASAAPTAEPSRAPTPTPALHRVGVTPRVTPKPTASTAPTVTPAAPATASATPPAAPSGSSKGRKFRTDLD